MAAYMITPPLDSDSSIRKRVCKACDRCRLKKSKCDGATPCSRCRSDNAICVFGERKKSHDKIYPKGYVEMLEHQQAQLVNGLQELYRISTDGTGWEGPLLNDSSNGRPLTHDILDRLGVLQPDLQPNFDTFDEDPEAVHQRFAIESADVPPRRESLDSDRESSQSSIYDPTSHRAPFSSQFAGVQLPTPPLHSPSDAQSLDIHPKRHWHSLPKNSQVRPQSLQIYPNYSNWDTSMNPLALQSQRWVDSPIPNETHNGPLPTEFPNLISTDTIVTMPDWTEDDFNSFLNITMT